ILDRSLAKDLGQRYRSCREFHRDLERFLVSSGKTVGTYHLARVVAYALNNSPALTPPPRAPPSPAPSASVSGPLSGEPQLSPLSPSMLPGGSPEDDDAFDDVWLPEISVVSPTVSRRSIYAAVAAVAIAVGLGGYQLFGKARQLEAAPVLAPAST